MPHWRDRSPEDLSGMHGAVGKTPWISSSKGIFVSWCMFLYEISRSRRTPSHCRRSPRRVHRSCTGGHRHSPEVQVDALLALHGVGSSLGESSKAALLTAEDDINRSYREIGSPTRVRVVIHDTGSDPATALELAKQVRTTGRRFVIGYLSSAESRPSGTIPTRTG